MGATKVVGGITTSQLMAQAPRTVITAAHISVATIKGQREIAMVDYFFRRFDLESENIMKYSEGQRTRTFLGSDSATGTSHTCSWLQGHEEAQGPKFESWRR